MPAEPVLSHKGWLGLLHERLHMKRTVAVAGLLTMGL
jgi:hypothetical protein